ncbi:type VI secretion system ATPase TssH [Desulfonema magnum]|uniref:Chaperone protein ClpB n=1 Tax=Desulfonema magnum TaxID=45655 RepID=A0A975GMG1_9BACT|nr:type VI secretion system ATPase TssH [Desulfonema magnum]QTA85813.1 Chaperone protein ClpB [Desulfonema magnum]
MSLDLQTLIAKLNVTCRKGLEKAAQLCVSYTNYNVEIEHLLMTLLDIPDADIQRVLRYYEVSSEDVNKELTLSIEKFRRGNSRTPALSQHILRILEQAWMIASLRFDSDTVRTGAILLALLEDDALRAMLFETSPSLKRIPKDAIKNDIREIIRFSGEETRNSKLETGNSKFESPLATDHSPLTTDHSPLATRPSPLTKTPNLNQYTIDLTGRVRSGLVDPIQGRDMEIRQIIDILTRRRQNNPILTGEAGVGKTAIVEGFATRIVKGDVPPPLRNVSVRILDLGLLQAGAGIKGEFEKRLKSVIEEVKTSPRPIILFIDEAHTMIGAGGPAGMGDAANLLKPALARGELRTIAATTWGEYKKYFEKDPALTRRFQVVKVDEPTEEEAVEMLRGLVFNLEAHHSVIILDEAVQDAVRLSKRYISGRHLPDKAISVLDTACARVAIVQNSTPPQIEYIYYRKKQAELELVILKREQASGRNHAARTEELSGELEALKKRGEELEARWKDELRLVERLIEIQKNLEKTSELKQTSEVSKTSEVSVSETSEVSVSEISEISLEQLSEERIKLRQELEMLQQADPMIHICVDSGIIATVISNWTGIPVGKMLTNEIEGILHLKENMEERIIGQSQALDTICRRIRTFRANLDDPGKPAGVFLLIGSSGIGKTETALTLADLLYGGEENMVTLNMSEYQEPYTVSGLKGSPPGYVGYGQGGVLTEAVRRKPYSAVLLDEVEKAHPDVMELFYQVFDKGTLEDSEGLSVDFKNTIILLTSNIGTDTILEACHDFNNMPDAETLVKLVWPDLLQRFKPAFLGRLVVVPYYPLTDEVIRKIVRLKLDRIRQRFLENHRTEFTYSEELVAAIGARCMEVDTGARNVDHLLTHTMLPELSGELLRRMAVGEICIGIHVDLDESGGFAYHFDPIADEP